MADEGRINDYDKWNEIYKYTSFMKQISYIIISKLSIHLYYLIIKL